MAVAGAVGLLHLTAVRDAAAAALAQVVDTDPMVFGDAVESLTPPALLLDWADPWVEPAARIGSIGGCQWTARLQVICIAGRLEPGAGVDVLEQLVSLVVARLEADPYTWTLDSVSAPLQRDLAGISYLAANVVYAVPTSLRESP
jgi:hypothetical protein